MVYHITRRKKKDGWEKGPISREQRKVSKGRKRLEYS